MRTRLLPFVLVFAVSAAHSSTADAGAGTNAVRSANTKVRALLRTKAPKGSAAERKVATKLSRSLRAFLDTEELGRRALRDHWAKLTKAQRSEYSALLRTLIESNYVKGLRANLEYKVRYLSESKTGKDLVVSTELVVQRRGRPRTISIDYVLRRSGGKLRTYDIVTDGIGLVTNYRAQFNKIIAKRGFDDLLKRMRKKAAKLSK